MKKVRVMGRIANGNSLFIADLPVINLFININNFLYLGLLAHLIITA